MTHDQFTTEMASMVFQDLCDQPGQLSKITFDIEFKVTEMALKRVKYNIGAAARLLGMKRTTLSARLKANGHVLPAFVESYRKNTETGLYEFFETPLQS